MSNTTSRIALPYIMQSQSQKEVTHNAALDVMDALLQAAVISVGGNTPPETPAAGDCHVVGASPTGAWDGQAKAFAFYTTGWNFIAPWEGLTVWANDENLLYTYDGADWIATVNLEYFQNLSLLGVNTAADGTNKLAVASAAVLLNHIGTDMQVKINKNAAGDKASFLFQTGFSGRAEFGTLGDDHFTLKVSPDGSTFHDALKMLAGSGRAALKANGSALSAAGSAPGDAAPVTKQTNEFTTVGSGQGAILPSPEQGEFIFIANAAANALNVYPASGHSIDALAADAPFSLAAGKNALFWAATASQWYALGV